VGLRAHLIAHGAEQVELEAITSVLVERIRHNANRAVADPPSYVCKTPGPRPADRHSTTTLTAAWRAALETTWSIARRSAASSPRITWRPSMAFIVRANSATSSDEDGTGTRSCRECDPMAATRDVTA